MWVGEVLGHPLTEHEGLYWPQGGGDTVEEARGHLDGSCSAAVYSSLAPGRWVSLWFPDWPLLGLVPGRGASENTHALSVLSVHHGHQGRAASRTKGAPQGIFQLRRATQTLSIYQGILKNKITNHKECFISAGVHQVQAP